MPARWNPSRRYWEIDAHVTLPSGKSVRLRRKSPINTKSAATAYEQQAVKETLAHAAAGRKGPVPKFAAFADEYLRKYAASNNRASTYRSVRQIVRDHLGPTLGRTLLDEITPETIEGLKAKLLQTHSALTVRNVLSTLRRILSLAVEWGRLGRAPKIKLPPSPPADFDHLTIEEGQRLLEGAAAAVPGWAPLLRLALRTGLRVGELRGLQWPDLDLERGQLVVRRAVVRDRVQPPKSGKIRHLPLPADAVDAMKALRAQAPGRALWVFTMTRDGGPVSQSAIGRALWRACAAADLRPIHPHALRHSYASQLVRVGVPLRVVQELLGHSTITTTERYAHLAPGATTAAVQQLEAAVRASTGEAATRPATLARGRNKAKRGEG